MFFAPTPPLDLDPARLAALRVSLNAPIVSVAELPSGPARAAIALWWEADERLALEVHLTSAATGDRVAYAFEDALEDAGDVERALEAALNFAESMGFLFDEDVLSGEDTADRARVRRALAELGAAPDAASDGGGEERGEAGLLELTELAEPEPREPDPEPPAAPAPQAGAPEDHAGAVLTKFRTARPAGADARPDARPDADPQGESPRARGPGAVRAALGRVPLVRRRRTRRERPGLLLRILGAF